MPPPLPVTAMGYVPTAVLLPTARVVPEVPAPGAAIGLGLKLTVVPAFTPVADKVMPLLKPPLTVVGDGRGSLIALRDAQPAG